MLEEFKKFILKGNMVDLAVGIIIGAAFGKVVEKFAEMLTSTVGWILHMAKVPQDSLTSVGIDPTGPKYGPVLTATINLLIVGFALFIFIKAYNRFMVKPQPAAAQPPPTQTEKLLMEIRDAMQLLTKRESAGQEKPSGQRPDAVP